MYGIKIERLDYANVNEMLDLLTSAYVLYSISNLIVCEVNINVSVF